MPLQTWVARFVVDHGQVTEEGKRLRAFQRRRVDEPEIDLHLLAEPVGVGAEELGLQALEAIGRFFVRENLSLTGGLTRALAATHQTLVDWNRRSLAAQQVFLGISAVGLRGTTAYVAQAGPSLAFYRHDGRLERLAPTDEAATPLGEGLGQPEIRRIDLQPGDLLVVASPALEALLDVETLDGVLSRGSDDALPELYLLTRDLPDFALFAVTCFETPDDPAEALADDPVSAEPPEALAAEVEGRGQEPEVGPAPALSFEPQKEQAKAAERARTLVPPPPLDISRPVVRLRSDQSIGRSEYARTTGPPPLFRFSFRLRPLLGLIAGGAIVAFIVGFAVPDLVQENRHEKVASLIGGARAAYAAALSEPDAAKRRVYLEDVRRLASEVERVEPENETAGDLWAQATAGLKGLDAVFDLGPMTTVTTLSRQVTGDISVERLVVAGGVAYVLDSRGRRIIAVNLGTPGAAVTVYEEGQTYGGMPAKRPLFMTWDRSGGGRLLVLDSERKLFELRAGQTPQPLPLRRTGAWSSVAAIAAYDGNLYVLDPAGNQVHRYLPAATGFDSEPGPALGAQVSLSGARGLVVTGDIYVLVEAEGSASARIRRFRGGMELDYSLGGIDRPLVSPTSITALVGASEVLVADTGNKRVVVASSDGEFRRQFVSNAFTDLRAIAVDDAGAQIYVVVGDALLTAPMVR